MTKRSFLYLSNKSFYIHISLLKDNLLWTVSFFPAVLSFIISRGTHNFTRLLARSTYIIKPEFGF